MPGRPGQSPGNESVLPDGGNRPENGGPVMENVDAVSVFNTVQDSRTAAETAGIDASTPWSAAIEGIRRFFSEQPAQNLSFNDDYIYVRAPMPEGSGYPYVMIGIEVDDGRLESVRFALPGRFSDSPPAGLDGYVWRGGPTEGWWVLTVDPRTGNPTEFDD